MGVPENTELARGHQTDDGGAPTSCDLQVALQLADSLWRAGQYQLVVDYYRWAGAAFIQRAEPHNALAVYSLLAQLVPHCLHTHAMIAEQYRVLGEIEQAAGIYERIAYTHVLAGRLREAVGVYRLVVELSPSDVARRVALAESCVQLGHVDEACQHLEIAAAQLCEAGRAGEYVWTARRLLGLRPDDVPTMRQLARVQLDGQDVYGAVQTLRELMAIAPRDDQGRELMAEAFAAQGQYDLACRAAVVLAYELRGRGYLADAHDLARRAMCWNPSDPSARHLVAELQYDLVDQPGFRQGSHTRGEIRAPGVPMPIPTGRVDDEDTNVLPLHARRRRSVTYDQHGAVVTLDFHAAAG